MELNSSCASASVNSEANDWTKKYRKKVVPKYFNDLQKIFGEGRANGAFSRVGGSLTSKRGDLKEHLYGTNRDGADTTPIDATPSVPREVMELRSLAHPLRFCNVLWVKEASFAKSNGQAENKKKQPTTNEIMVDTMSKMVSTFKD
ncbi:hypothetical protein AMTR_s00005p00252510 [Amborella trichopoda]|uniref:Uncharacterized protein n=1 Tax=Amborella trichopoda TaxID=13333 RepID=W1PG09_AMBTC|nr:hypothetical protein AMTR_s00005p00252510 [Amborella trichopoda]